MLASALGCSFQGRRTLATRHRPSPGNPALTLRAITSVGVPSRRRALPGLDLFWLQILLIDLEREWYGSILGGHSVPGIDTDRHGEFIAALANTRNEVRSISIGILRRGNTDLEVITVVGVASVEQFVQTCQWLGQIRRLDQLISRRSHQPDERPQIRRLRSPGVLDHRASSSQLRLDGQQQDLEFFQTKPLAVETFVSSDSIEPCPLCL